MKPRPVLQIKEPLQDFYSTLRSPVRQWLMKKKRQPLQRNRSIFHNNDHQNKWKWRAWRSIFWMSDWLDWLHLTAATSKSYKEGNGFQSLTVLFQLWHSACILINGSWNRYSLESGKLMNVERCHGWLMYDLSPAKLPENYTMDEEKQWGVMC